MYIEWRNNAVSRDVVTRWTSQENWLIRSGEGLALKTNAPFKRSPSRRLSRRLSITQAATKAITQITMQAITRLPQRVITQTIKQTITQTFTQAITQSISRATTQGYLANYHTGY